MSNRIKEFVIKVLNDKTNTHLKINVKKVKVSEAKKIFDLTGINIKGYVHAIDSSGVKHVIKQHSVISEYKRGQIPIILDDFELIPEILTNFDLVEYGEKNKAGRHLIVYQKKIEKGISFYVEEVRSPKKKECVIQTMYIRKKQGV